MAISWDWFESSMSVSDTQDFRLEDRYSLEKNFMPIETPVRGPTAKSTGT